MRKLRLMGLAMLALAVATAQAQTYKVLFNFGKYSGDTIEPAWSGLFAQARDGNLYTTSQSGGSGFGTVVQLTTDGKEKVLHTFTAAEGRPYGGLTLGLDGFLYGVTVGGGTVGRGTVYKIGTDGTFAVVHNFNGGTEGDPWYGNTAPIQGIDGSFYGAVSDGSANSGIIYKMTTAGAMKELFTFTATVRYP